MGNRFDTEIWAILVVTVLLAGSVPHKALAQGKKGHPETVARELATIANQLGLRPETALDFTAVSGEYCFDAGLGKGAHMTHYAVDPTKTKEDVTDFVNAASLIKAGVNVESLPRFPGTIGSMTPNQWYFLPAGEMEPHHGKPFPFPLLMKASDLKKKPAPDSK
jgi:hypothetical protein